MGKRLIGMGMARHASIEAVLTKGTLVIIAGTTNGYVAEEILKVAGQADGFSREGFRRGLTTPPGVKVDKHPFDGDVVLVDGKWDRGKVITDVAGDLKEGDVVVKGANAVNLCLGRAGVLVGHARCGTAGAAVPAVVGARVKLIVPVGLEKRVTADINDIADKLNAPGATGPRMLPLPGEVFTELDAISLPTGAEVHLVAGGGTFGAEGCVWIAAEGNPEALDSVEQLIQSVTGEPPCRV